MFPVLWHKSDAVMDSIFWGPDTDLPAFNDYPTGIESIRPKYGSRHFSASGAYQPGHAQNFASPHFETNVFQYGRTLISGIGA